MKEIPIFVLLSSRQYVFIWNEFLFLPFIFQGRVNRKEASTNEFAIVCLAIFLSISCILKPLVITCHNSNSDMFLHDFMSVS